MVVGVLASTATAGKNRTKLAGTGAPKLVAIVLVAHFVANVLHTVTHFGVDVYLGPELGFLVALSVYVLPLVGGVLVWYGSTRIGAAVLTAGIAASFVLSQTLHFVVQNPDHVSNVPVGSWEVPFVLSAVGLALVDGVGVSVALALWWATTAGDDLPGSSRIDGVPWTGFRPLTRLSYWVSRRWFDAVPESLTVMAHHGGVLAGTSAFETALLSGEAVDDRLKSLAVEKAAMETGCPFCIDVGAAEAAKLGITDEQLNDLPAFEDSNAFSDDERLVLRYAVAVSSTPVTVSDELFDELRATFDERELVELTAAIAWENYRGRFNHAFGIEAQGFAE